MSKSSLQRARFHVASPKDMLRPNREAAIGAMIKPQPDGCWLFTGQINSYGYGVVVAHGNQSEMAHRFVYRTLVDEIPDDHVLHHECHVKHCVNPAHLTPMTRSDHVSHHHDLRAAAEAA